MEKTSKDLGSFQTNIFSIQCNKSKQKNVILSPLSIYQVLCLTANGAEGKTKEGMLKSLSSKEINEINSINQKIIEITKKFSTCTIANGVFTSFTPLENFINSTKIYESPVEQIISEEQINEWCKEKTKGKIEKIVDKIDDVKMLLLNAVNFDGEWEHEFKAEQTTKEEFKNFNKEENKIQVDMMQIKQRLIYYEKNGIKAIKKTYKEDKIYGIFILPPEDKEINEFISNELNQQIIKDIIKGEEEYTVILNIPKFDLKYSEELNDSLNQLGMEIAFSNCADFSKMKAEKDIKISKVLHKTMLKMDELGTKAAAVSAVEMIKLKGKRRKKEEEIKYFTCDRPFLFFIVNDELPENNQIIFMSKIEKL